MKNSSLDKTSTLLIFLCGCLFFVLPLIAFPKTQQTVTFGGDANYPPFEWYENGQPIGFNIDLENSIAGIGQARAKHQLGNWPEMVKALENGEIDVLPMFLSNEREETFLFSSPFYFVSHALYATSEAEQINSLINLSGKRIAVEELSFAHEKLQVDHPEAVIVLANNTLDALRKLSNKKADYAVLALPIAARLIEEQKLNINRMGPPFWPEGYAFAVNKNRPELAAWLDDSLKLAISTGEYNNVYSRWQHQIEPGQSDIYDHIKTISIIILPILLLTLIGFIWSWNLKRTVQKQTLQIHLELELRKAAEAEIVKMLNYDASTGLPRYHHVLHLAAEAYSNKSQDVTLEMIILKLAETEMITRVFGLVIEEAFIKAFSERLISLNFHICGYIGRGVFIIICNKNMFIDQFDSITSQINVNRLWIYPQVNAGIAIWDSNKDNAEEIGRKAETALAVCSERKDNWALYAPTMEPDKLDLQIVNDFRLTKSANLYALLQPQIDLSTGNLVGAEALVRWESTKLGNIAPIKFIPLLEKAGLIKHVTEFMINEAARMSAKLRKMNKPATISVNVSVLDLQTMDLPILIRDTLFRHGARSEDIKLELTETAIAENLDQVKMVLNTLSRMGISTSIDDFGTGYSSLSYLSSLPINEVKIERMFVKDIAENPRNKSIVRSTIAMAHALEIKVTAEGVENEDCMKILKDESCDRAQGYFISVPLTEEQFENFSWHQKPLN